MGDQPAGGVEYKASPERPTWIDHLDYLVATIGRRWLMDRRNLEPTDLAAFPVPILDLNDPRLDGLLNNEGAALDRFILNALGLEGDYERAVEEFLDFRILYSKH